VGDGDNSQHFGESEADESISVEYLHLKRRRSQQNISRGVKKAKIASFEVSNDPGADGNVGGDNDVVYASDDDGVTVEDEQSQIPQKYIVMILLEITLALAPESRSIT